MSEDWQELKKVLIDEIVDKPLKIKTDGKSIELIALELRASQLASEKIIKFVRKIEKLGSKMSTEEKIKPKTYI